MRNPMREFPPGVGERLRSYVYLYYDPSSPSEPFYIGKGTGNRVFDHLQEAESARDGRKVRAIRKVWRSGHDVMITIHRHDMGDNEASNVEAALIELFPNAMNEVAGKGSLKKGSLPIEEIVVRYRPQKITIREPAILITIRKLWPWVFEARSKFKDIGEYEKRLYSATRSCWVIQPKNHPEVSLAVALRDGVIRQVYRMENWRKADVDGCGKKIQPNGRWMFEGEIAVEKSDWVGKSLSDGQAALLGAQNPIRGINESAPLSRRRKITPCIPVIEA